MAAVPARSRHPNPIMGSSWNESLWIREPSRKFSKYEEADWTSKKQMKTRTLQLTALAGIAIAIALLASPYVIAATTTTSNSTSSSGNTSYPPSQQRIGLGWFNGMGSGIPGQSRLQNAPALTTGQTITVTSTQGMYEVIGTPGDNGTASGTITFTVTSKLSEGYTLSITSGSLVVDGTTYTISSGTAQTGRFASVITGQGTTTPSGEFLLRASARGSFAGSTGQLSFDFQAGSTEYAVALIGTIQS